eukprot:UN09735
MSNKTYILNKQTGTFKCLHCNYQSKTKSRICKHVFEEKKKENRLTPFDRHRTKQCGQNSRMCRYCHPEPQIMQKDVDESLNHNLKNTIKFVS